MNASEGVGFRGEDSIAQLCRSRARHPKSHRSIARVRGAR